MKRYISLFTCLVMVLVGVTWLSHDVDAASYSTSGSCGPDATWSLQNGVLTIDGSGAMYDPLYSSAPWGYCKEHIHTVKIYGVSSVSAFAFEDITSLTSVYISNSVKEIQNGAFRGCTGLERVKTYSLSHWCEITFYDKTANPLSYAEEFSTDYGKVDFENLIIPDSVRKIGNNAFAGLKALRSVTIPKSVTYIGSDAFANCTQLSQVNLTNGLLEIGGQVFKGCTSLKEITIPKSVSDINVYTFDGASNLMRITVDPDNPYYTSDTSGVLFNKTMTECQHIPSGMTGHYMMPDSVTILSLQGFEYSMGLESVTIGTGVIKIASGVFGHCPNLKNIYYKGSASQWDSIDIAGSNTALESATIYYNHVHDYTLFTPNVVAPTCTEDGYIEYKCVYGETYKENTPALGHDYTGPEGTVAPTCLEYGYSGASCTRCDAVRRDNDIEPVGHNAVLVSEKEPTCTQAGNGVGTICSQCGTYLLQPEVIPAIGHSFTNYISDENATCSKDGTKTAKCDRCGVGNTVTDVGSKLPHNYTNKVTKPTCTAQGYTTYTCTCGYSYKTNYTDAAGHNYSYRVTKTPTVSASGTLTGSCSKCSGTTTVVMQKMDTNNYTYRVVTAATCTTSGTGRYTWKTTAYGNFYFSVTIPATGHSYTEKITKPTCTAQGYTTYTCACGNSYVADRQSALGHSFSNYISNNDATYEADGTKTAKCDRCEITNTVTDSGSMLVRDGWYTQGGQKYYYINGKKAVGWIQIASKWYYFNASGVMLTGVVTIDGTHHKFSESGVWMGDDHSFSNYISNKDATCETDGTKTAKCEYPGCDVSDTVVDEGTRLGHSFTNYISDGNATCTVDGTKTAKCDRCTTTDTELDAGSAKGHDYKGMVTSPTCTMGGYTTYTCFCGDSYVDNYVEAQGHSFTAYISDDNATCTVDGTKTAKCDRCTTTDTELDAGSAKGHDYKGMVTSPTCTMQGYTTYTCFCGDSYVDNYVEAQGHSFTNYISDNNATYDADGTKTAKCDRCDVTNTVTDSGTKLQQTNGWVFEGGKWYYYKNGDKATGWLQVDKVWYYFDGNGIMQTGWQSISGAWYYFAGSGTMQTGWLQLGRVWYYLDSSGAMVTGWKLISGAYYYFNGSGVMQTGWLKSGNNWYYLYAGGKMATGWAQVSGKWYYFSGSGAMLTGWQKIGATWYYFQSGGAMQTGWLKLNGTWYYFDSSGAMATGSVVIGAKTYNFNSSGACLNP